MELRHTCTRARSACAPPGIVEIQIGEGGERTGRFLLVVHGSPVLGIGEFCEISGGYQGEGGLSRNVEDRGREREGVAREMRIACWTVHRGA